MRTKFAFIGVAGFVIATAMFFGSGAAPYFDATGTNDAPGQSAADDAGVEEPSIKADPSTGGSIAGLVVGSAGKIETFISLAAYWPNFLKWLGFPAWFADPIGIGTEILALLGLAQFISGRLFE